MIAQPRTTLDRPVSVYSNVLDGQPVVAIEYGPRPDDLIDFSPRDAMALRDQLDALCTPGPANVTAELDEDVVALHVNGRTFYVTDDNVDQLIAQLTNARNRASK